MWESYNNKPNHTIISQTFVSLKPNFSAVSERILTKSRTQVQVGSWHIQISDKLTTVAMVMIKPYKIHIDSIGIFLWNKLTPRYGSACKKWAKSIARFRSYGRLKLSQSQASSGLVHREVRMTSAAVTQGAQDHPGWHMSRRQTSWLLTSCQLLCASS